MSLCMRLYEGSRTHPVKSCGGRAGVDGPVLHDVVCLSWVSLHGMLIQFNSLSALRQAQAKTGWVIAEPFGLCLKMWFDLDEGITCRIEGDLRFYAAWDLVQA